MDDDSPDKPPEPRSRRNLIAIVSVATAAVAAAITTWWLWLAPSEPRESDTAQDPPTPPDEGRDDDNPSQPAPSEEPQGDSGDHEAPECDVACDSSALDRACADAVNDACHSQTAECSPDLDCGSQGCASGSSSLVSSAVVLPLAAVARVPSRRRTRRSLPSRGALAAISLYQRHVAPRTATRCRYVPTCSRYGRSVIARHGLRRGARLSVARVRSCTKRVPHGTVDPPP